MELAIVMPWCACEGNTDLQFHHSGRVNSGLSKTTWTLLPWLTVIQDCPREMIVDIEHVVRKTSSPW